MRKLRWMLRATLVAAFAAFGAGAVAAQQGTVTGTITDADGGKPLAGARVQIIGTALQATTNQSGKYTIAGVSPGARELRAVFVGYESGRRSVTVAAGETVTADFALKTLPYTLDEIVSTATGDQRKIELGNVVARVQSDSLVATAPVRQISDVLQGRVAGVTLQQSSGTTGTGSQIRIRGLSSVSLSNEPIIFIDGVRVESGVASNSIGVGGQSPSRINDINPEEIEAIEIVKGPSASTLYGPDAGNGVILITTKKGKAGKPQWTTYAEGGLINDTKRYPVNYANFGTQLTGANAGSTVRNCTLQNAAAGVCRIDSVTTFDPLRNPVTSPLAQGYRQQYGANVAGGSDFARYFFAGEYENEIGAYGLSSAEQQRLITQRGYTDGVPFNIRRPNELTRVNIRTNASANVFKNAELSAQLGITSSQLRLPTADNSVLGSLTNYLTGPGFVGDTLGNGGNNFGHRPGELFSRFVRQDVERYVGSATFTWSPINWLQTRVVGGYDLTNRVDKSLDPRGEAPNFSTLRSEGARTDNRTNIRQYTGTVDATARYSITKGVTGKTFGGIQYFRNSFLGNRATGENIAPGNRTLIGASRQFVSEVNVTTATIGYIAEQQVAVKDRLFLTGAMRQDRAAAVGRNFNSPIVPRASVSYLLSDEGFFPKNGVLNTLRLRGAWGRSSVLPQNALVAEQTFNFVGVTVLGTDVPGVVLGNLGNPNLGPEISTETEVGFDATLLNDKVSVEFTAFRKNTRDALISRVLAPSLGVSASQLFNLGGIRNEGLELAVNLRPIQSKALNWDMTLTGSLLRNNVQSLGTNLAGQPLPPILDIGGTQRTLPGYPVAGYWDRPITGFADANGDGLIGVNEVTVGDTAEYLGSVIPLREAAMNTAITVLDGKLRIGAQIDYRGAYRLTNLSERFRCFSAFGGGNCQARRDPTTPLDQQARQVATSNAVFGNTFAGFIEDASFMRFRELSATYTAPKSFAKLFSAANANFTFAVRNVGFLLNKYTGIDPEVNGFGQGGNFARDFFSQPPTRNFVFRASFGF